MQRDIIFLRELCEHVPDRYVARLFNLNDLERWQAFKVTNLLTGHTYGEVVFLTRKTELIAAENEGFCFLWTKPSAYPSSVPYHVFVRKQYWRVCIKNTDDVDST